VFQDKKSAGLGRNWGVAPTMGGWRSIFSPGRDDDIGPEGDIQRHKRCESPRTVAGMLSSVILIIVSLYAPIDLRRYPIVTFFAMPDVQSTSFRRSEAAVPASVFDSPWQVCSLFFAMQLKNII
jgi:hypothetical protein